MNKLTVELVEKQLEHYRIEYNWLLKNKFEVDKIADLDSFENKTVSFAYLNKCESLKSHSDIDNSLLIVENGAEQKCEIINNLKCAVLSVVDPRLVFILLSELLEFELGYKIEPTAVIDPTAKLAKYVSIGHNSVIGKNVTIGNNVRIGHNVVIYDHVVIGDNCLILDNSVIGCSGVGASRDPQGNYHIFPHIKSVVLEDNIFIGANCTLSRGTLRDTYIKSGTKINSNSYIAHGVEIGAQCFVSVSVTIAGSAIIGDNCWLAPGVTVRDRIKIADNITVGLGAVVTKDLEIAGTYIGHPAKESD